MSAGHGHDAWHHHTAAEGVPQHEHGAHASAKALGLTFIIMVFGVIAVILILIVYFNTYVSAFKAQQLEGTALMQPAFEARQAASHHLGSHGWIDRDAGTVHVPLEDAMRQVINEYQTQTQSRNGAASSDAQG